MRARMPRVTPMPMHSLSALLKSDLVCRLANSPVADVTDSTTVVGFPDDENEIADAEDAIEADAVEDGDVVDVDEAKIEVGVKGDTGVGVGVGVGVDEYGMTSVVDDDHVIGERSDLHLCSRSEYSP